MPGILDSNYGVTEAKRERRTKLILYWSLGVILLGTILYFSFRTYSQERVVKQFFSLLRTNNYQDAYRLWGCTQETPCKYYPPEKFTEDWGPSGQYKDAALAKIENVDVCGSGVIFAVSIPKVQPFGLWVESNTNVLSFAPSDWTRCPGKHLQIWEFIKSKF
jgi:hypothetical protein